MSGFTKIPNEVLDKMADLTGAEFKLAMALCRLTYGYRKQETRSSLAQLSNLTGLSRQGILNAADKIGHLFLRKNDGGVTLWVVNSVDQYQSNDLTGVVNSVDQTSQLSLPPSNKENLKENIKIKWEDVLNLLDFFTETTHIKQPLLGADGWEPYREKWIDPIMDLLGAYDYDCQAVRQKMTGAVKLMREKELIIATPKSIYNVALSINGSTSGKVTRVEGGGMYV